MVERMKKEIIVLTSILSLAVILSGCADISYEGTPSITSFIVNPSIINQGETANLSWIVVGATSINIDNGIGSVSLIGNRIIQPNETTTYTLTASNSNGSANATVQIIVQSLPLPTPPSLTLVQNAATQNGWVNFTVDSASVDAKWDELQIIIDDVDFGTPTPGVPLVYNSCGHGGTDNYITPNERLYVRGNIEPGMELVVYHPTSNSRIATKTIY